MLTVAEYRARILCQVRPGASQQVPLATARGRVLTRPLVSAVPLPGFDNSAMDGYAVHAADVADATEDAPVVLPVDGDIAAGNRARHEVPPGRAMRIMTGAPMPAGADAVVPVEHTDGGLTEVEVRVPAEAGRHIRREGEDVGPGDVVVDAPAVVGPRQIAVAAAAGCGAAWVTPRPRVLVMSTGDELIEVGGVPAFGEVVDSNGAMLTALLETYGFEYVRVGGVEDTSEAVLRALSDGIAQGCSAAVTTGGVSMGAYDAVKEALREQGVRFERVAMMPGKPQGFGRVRMGPAPEEGVPVFTLPGNPVSAYVSFHVFVLPALQLMAGHRPTGLPVREVRVEGPAPAMRERKQYQRVTVRTDEGGHLVARILAGQGSHMLGGLADADGLLIVPPEGGAHVERAQAGRFDCLMLIDAAATPPALAGPLQGRTAETKEIP